MKLENFKLMVKLKLKEIYSKNELKLNQLEQMIQSIEEVIENIKNLEHTTYEIKEREIESIETLKKSKEKLIRIKDLIEESMKIEIECPNCKKTIFASSFYIEGKFKYVNEKVVCVNCIDEEIRENNSIYFKKE